MGMSWRVKRVDSEEGVHGRQENLAQIRTLSSGLSIDSFPWSLHELTSSGLLSQINFKVEPILSKTTS